MCELCFSRGDNTMFDENANVIFDQELNNNEMPNFVCLPCYNHLEKINRFHMQVIQSERRMRHCLEQLRAFHEKRQLQSPSYDSFDNINADMTAEEKFENCDKSKNTSINRENTKKSSETNLPHQYDVEGMRSPRVEDFKRSKEYLAEEKPYHCDVCNKRFFQKISLMVHKRIHCVEKPYHCNVCNKRFIQKETLILHKLIHIVEKPYYCDVCIESFNKKTTLVVHKLIQHTYRR